MKSNSGFYKIKHAATGLFYCPSRQTRIDGKYKKSNLSKAGKIYASESQARSVKTNILKTGYYDETGSYQSYANMKVNDFEIVQVAMAVAA